MDADGVFHKACIAPRERRRDGNSMLAGFFKHFAVPQHQALLRQGQSTELVFTIRVCTANVKNHVRTKLIECGLHGGDERSEIFVVVGTIPHVQIDGRRRFMRRIVVLLMDRERKDTSVIAKNCRSAIAMVDVGIDDEGLANRAVRLKAPYRNGDIVDGTESFAVTWISMMEAAAEITTETISQRGLRREDCAACGEPDGLDEFLRIRHLEPHLFAGGQRASLQLARPICRMDAEDVLIGGRRGPQKVFFHGDSLVPEHFRDETKLLRRKDMWAKIKIVTFVENQLEGQHGERRG